jgi:hypothetical protein
LDRLRLKLNAEGLIDLNLWCIDSTFVRASRSAAGAGTKGDAKEPERHALGLSQGGFGAKIHLVTDGTGLPLAFALTPGQRYELTAFERALKAMRLPGPRGRPRTRPKPLAGEGLQLPPGVRVSASPPDPARDPASQGRQDGTGLPAIVRP